MQIIQQLFKEEERNRRYPRTIIAIFSSTLDYPHSNSNLPPHLHKSSYFRFTARSSRFEIPNPRLAGSQLDKALPLTWFTRVDSSRPLNPFTSSNADWKKFSEEILEEVRCCLHQQLVAFCHH